MWLVYKKRSVKRNNKRVRDGQRISYLHKVCVKNNGSHKMEAKILHKS